MSACGKVVTSISWLDFNGIDGGAARGANLPIALMSFLYPLGSILQQRPDIREHS